MKKLYKVINLFSVMVLLLFMYSCNNQKTEFKMNGNLNYLALGDSYTIGESVPETGRWPVQLAEVLNKDGIKVNDPVIIAQTGWTTNELALAIHDRNIREKFDLVSLLIGVNNQYRGRSLLEYGMQFKQLLATAIDYAGGDKNKVFVVSIPDWGVTPFAEGKDKKLIENQINLFNDAARNTCLSEGVDFYDITPYSREVRNDSDLVAGDGLHPSAKMYEGWVNIIKVQLAQKLKKNMK
ncbi:SGNH/GDSL hydrolase family protein [soil metagenome]